MFVSDIQSWVLRKNQLSASEFQGLTYIAAEADGHGNYYGGQAHLVKTSGMKPRTLQRVIAQLREKDLLHSERRPCPLERGRMNDVIVLHLANSDWETPLEVDPVLEDYQRRLREAYELIEELTGPNLPVDNLVDIQPANLAGKYKTPSQNLDANLAGKSVENVSTRQKVRIYPPKMVDLPANLAGKSESALKGTARATRALKGNLLIDLNQSISQSPISSTGAREPKPAAPVTDGLIDHAPQAEICQLPAAAFLGQVRRGLTRCCQMDTSTFSDTQLTAAIEEILSRTNSAVLENPIGFCIKAIGNEPGGLPALLEAAELKACRQQVRDRRVAVPKRVKPSWCQLHNREYTSAACPVCSNPRMAALEEPQNSLPVVKSPKEDPLSGAGMPLKRP